MSLVAVAGCGGASGGSQPAAEVSISGAASGLHGTAIRTGFPLPDESFSDTEGKPFVPSRAEVAPVTVVFFGYTHCPDVCNVVLANVATALRRTDPAVRERVRLLFITADPDRDSPSVVRRYLDRFDKSFIGLLASVPTVRSAARSMHISYDGKSAETSDGYEVSHGTELTGFVEGRARVLWRAETSVADLRADLTKLSGQ